MRTTSASGTATPSSQRQPLAAQVQRPRARGARVAVDDRRPTGAAGADLLHQRDRALERDDLGADVGAALEARRGFGLQAEPLARAPDRRRLEVRALEARPSVVAADTSDAAPPITPATACARSRSAMTSMSGSSVRSTPSSVVIVSPGLARRTRISAPARRAQVERVHRLADLDVHVVGDVDDRADRPDAGGLQPRGHPRRRRRRRSRRRPPRRIAGTAPRPRCVTVRRSESPIGHRGQPDRARPGRATAA